MRMWMINPKVMCRKHLLGEHVECHMFLGSIKKGLNLDGYITNGLLSLNHLILRHEELKAEMIRRGYKHNSEMNNMIELNLGHNYFGDNINIKENYKELARRCLECKRLQNEMRQP